MFTGIIQSTGVIEQLNRSEKGADIRVRVITPKALQYQRWLLGDSVALSGVCLTVTAMDSNCFEAQLSHETVTKTTFSHLKEGSEVNLEAALRVGDSLGGHWVSGHVDDIAEIVNISETGFSKKIDCAVYPQWSKYLAVKGSVTLDGISLTLNASQDNIISINAIPHTLENTTIGNWETGRKVNMEIDLLARYILNAQRLTTQ